jgi:hypothetical protein
MGSVSLYQAPPDGDSAIRVFLAPDVEGDEWDRGGIVFSGDALFAGGIGRTDLGGDAEMLARSIRSRLFGLPDDTLVLSGHGGPTTIGRERRSNPFVGEGVGW